MVKIQILYITSAFVISMYARIGLNDTSALDRKGVSEVTLFMLYTLLAA